MWVHATKSMLVLLQNQSHDMTAATVNLHVQASVLTLMVVSALSLLMKPFNKYKLEGCLCGVSPANHPNPHPPFLFFYCLYIYIFIRSSHEQI